MQKFIQVIQNYYMYANVDLDLGINKNIFIEVAPEINDIYIGDDYNTDVLNKLKSLGLDLDERTKIDPYSDDTVCVWYISDVVDWIGIIKNNPLNKTSIHFLDGTFKNT